MSDATTREDQIIATTLTVLHKDMGHYSCRKYGCFCTLLPNQHYVLKAHFPVP